MSQSGTLQTGNKTDPLAQEDIDHLLKRETLRVRSLVVTVCGDCIAPNGGIFFLGALFRLLKPLGVSDRAIRTSVFRLSQDGMFETSRKGRRSRYILTRAARRQFGAAERRIYRSGVARKTASKPLNASVDWTLILLPSDLSGAQRDQIRKELGWQGFSPLSPTVLGHANPVLDEAVAALKGMGMLEKAVVMTANVSSVTAPTALATMVGNAWPLEELNVRYQSFINAYAPLFERVQYCMKTGIPQEPEVIFALRVLLVHEYRRILLRDPGLPVELAPEGWRGEDARGLFEKLYRRLAPDSQDYMAAILAEENKSEIPKPHQWYSERFTNLVSLDRAEDHRVVTYDVAVLPE